jgi:hypothetical protein
MLKLIYILSPLVIGLFPTRVHSFLTTYELMTELTIFIVLLLPFITKHRRLEKESIFIFWAFFSLLIADSIFNVRLVLNITTYDTLKRLSGLCYSVFMVSLFTFVASKSQALWKGKFSKIFIFSVFGLYGYMMFKFIVIPYEHTTPPFPLFHKVTNFVYSLSSTALVALIIPYIMRTNRIRDFCFLQALLFSLFCDFCIRYQAAVLKLNTYSWAEPGWSLAFACILLILLRKEKIQLLDDSDTNLVSWTSVRALLTLAICLANLVLLFGILFVNIRGVENGYQLSSVMILFYLISRIPVTFL